MESQPMDDPELWAQVEALHPASYGWALSCCGHNPTDAEDIVQTAYLKILDGRARYEGRASLKTWLFGVIRLTAADDRRRRWLRLLRPEGTVHESAPEAPAPDHTDALLRQERLHRLREALASLPARQREVLHLVFYQEMTVEEAAAVMGVSAGSARTHYHRGKQRLGERMQTLEGSYV